MEQFRIRNNLILTKNFIAAVYLLEPIDLIILPENEQKSFEIDMRKMLNSIYEGHIQILMRTRKAIPKDLDRHFSSLMGSMNRRSDLVSEYIADLVELLDKHIIPVKEYYLVFSQFAKTSDVDDVIDKVKLLERNINRIASNFNRAGIVLSQIIDKQLITLARTYTRP